MVASQSEYTFTIEDLLTEEPSKVHGRRLKFFRNKDFNVTEKVHNHLAYQQNAFLVVQNFDNIRSVQGHVELLTNWRGFAEVESSWVSLALLREDVPELVKDYLNDIQKSGYRRQRSLAFSV